MTSKRVRGHPAPILQPNIVLDQVSGCAHAYVHVCLLFMENNFKIFGVDPPKYSAAQRKVT